MTPASKSHHVSNTRLGPFSKWVGVVVCEMGYKETMIGVCPVDSGVSLSRLWLRV